MSHKNGTVHDHNWTDWRPLRDNCVAEMLAERRKKERIRPLTANQAVYQKAIHTSVITLCSGPAGTGKTYMSCGIAAEMLREGRIEKIILTRPLVTCSGRRGQGVGFLKGRLMDKVSPYMQPMLEALEDFFSPAELRRHFEDKTIEVVPLDFMRGKSIANSFIVADEMQNAEEEQWLMLLTRIGENTKLVASGDATQSDLPYGRENGLLVAIDRLEGDPDISVVHLTEDDIVRHGIIRRILARWNARK